MKLNLEGCQKDVGLGHIENWNRFSISSYFVTSKLSEKLKVKSEQTKTTETIPKKKTNKQLVNKLSLKVFSLLTHIISYTHLP